MNELETETAQALAEGTRAFYQDAELYDFEFRRRRSDVNWYRHLAQQVGNGAPLSILDLGCGSGRMLLPLARDGHTVWGVDRSALMLQRCKHRLRSLNARARARVHILQGDFRHLPLRGRNGGEGTGDATGFPLILCPFNAFMHLYTRQDVELCLGEVRRLLSPGGLFAFDISHPDPAWLNRDPNRRYARTRFRHPRTGERLIYSTSHFYEPATQMAWIRFFYEPDSAASENSATEAAASRPRVIDLAQRLFFPAEIEALLHYNGFEILQHAGGFAPNAHFSPDPQGDPDGAALTIVSVEQVICARVR